MNIAFFDFDGTITCKDSFYGLLSYDIFKLDFYKKAMTLLPILFAYKIKIISNQKAKEIVLKNFFRDIKFDEFMLICQNYARKFDDILRPLAKEKLNWHKQNGDKIVIVSASLEEYLAPWCEKNSFELIASKLEVLDGRITGKLDGLNCHGDEKVRRIKEKYDLNSFEKIYAYGDTKGDLPMLKLAHESFYKPFREF